MTNNRDSVFTGSNHHMFMKIPVLETHICLHLHNKVVRLFVSVQIMVFRHLLVPVCGDIQQFAHQLIVIRVRGVVGNSPLSLITIIRHGFEITPPLFG